MHFSEGEPYDAPMDRIIGIQLFVLVVETGNCLVAPGRSADSRSTASA
jgi:hypothetical protein